MNAPTPHCFVNYNEEYPASRTFGEFPPDAQALLTGIVKKREATLTALRNKKDMRNDNVSAILNSGLQKAGFGSSPKTLRIALKSLRSRSVP